MDAWPVSSVRRDRSTIVLARIEPWFRNLCLLPMLALGCVYFETLVAALTLGHWPVPSVNDPKHLLTAPLHLVSTALVLLLHPLLLLVVAVAAQNWRVIRSNAAYWPWLSVLGLGWALIVLSGHFDPGAVWYWWWD